MSEERIEILRSVYEEWAEGNLNAGKDLLDEKVVFVNTMGPFDDTCYGRPEMQKWMREFLRLWDQYKAEATKFESFGDTVLVSVRQTGVGAGSEVPTDMNVFAVWTFRGSKVVRLENWPDRQKALEAAGLSE
jgi:ketosteroid isomerase-like protein